MKWKTKTKNKTTDWHRVFAWKPTKTEEGMTVFLEKVWKRYKLHMDSGKNVYSIKGPN